MIRDRNGAEVAAVGPGGDYEGTVDYDNAELIASAPDMLALIRRLSTWRPRGLEGKIEDDVAGIRQEACALLARTAAFLARVDAR